MPGFTPRDRGKAFPDEAGADEEHEGERDLSDDECAAEPHRLQTGGAFASIAQRIDRVDPGGVPRREKTEDDSGEQCCHARDQQDRRVQCDLIAARNPIARQTREEQIQTPAGEQDTAQSTDGDEQQRFDQMTARDRRAAGPKRETNRHFALPGGGPDELQAGDIGTGDEKHQQGRADDEKQTFAVIADDQIAERSQFEIPTFVEFRVALRESACDGPEFRLSARHRDARLQAADDAPKTRTRDEVLAAFVRKDPPLGSDVERILESARHDADDLVRHVVERDGFPHELAPAAELFLPKIVTEHDGRLGVGRRVFSRKGAADQRFLAEHPEIILGDKAAGE